MPFIRAWRQFFQLANLPAQAFAFTRQIVLGATGLRQRLLGGAPLQPQRFEFARVNAGIGVEQAAHRVCAGQALPGVLAVNVQQQLAQFAQLCGGGRAAVDPGAAFALCVHRAFEQQGVRGVKARLF